MLPVLETFGPHPLNDPTPVATTCEVEIVGRSVFVSGFCALSCGFAARSTVIFLFLWYETQLRFICNLHTLVLRAYHFCFMHRFTCPHLLQTGVNI